MDHPKTDLKNMMENPGTRVLTSTDQPASQDNTSKPEKRIWESKWGKKKN